VSNIAFVLQLASRREYLKLLVTVTLDAVAKRTKELVLRLPTLLVTVYFKQMKLISG
jgi:hypothetical protein